MTNQHLKSAQIEHYKKLIIEYVKTADNTLLSKRKYDKLLIIESFLKSTGVLTEEEEQDIIEQARKEAQQ
jgi:hypothetical protein